MLCGESLDAVWKQFLDVEYILIVCFFFQAEDGIRDLTVTGVQTCALPISKAGRKSIRSEDIERVRSKCVFTTHTPVPAGHDRFPMEYFTRVFPGQTGFLDLKDASSADLMKRVLQAEQNFPDLQEAARRGASLNMTQFALSLSTYVNGVAKQHGETSRQMFPEVPIEAITNGVHAGTWTSAPFQQLFDRYIPSWREDNYSLRSALGLPAEEVWA